MAVKMVTAGLFLAGVAASAQSPKLQYPSPHAPADVCPATQSIPGVIHLPEMPAAMTMPPILETPPAQEATTADYQYTAGAAVPPADLPRPVSPIRRTWMQATDRGADETAEYQIQLEPPGPMRVFRRETEKNLQQRMRNEAKTRPTLERIEFPVEEPLSRDPYTPRAFAPATEVVEPNYVCYDRLYFEEKNSERYGWDLGFVQPFVSAGGFYWDFISLPYHMFTHPCRKYECSAGYCLPGDPVPYLLYPPEISLTGSTIEAGIVIALIAIFPG
jgi:hypothetical protein